MTFSEGLSRRTHTDHLAIVQLSMKRTSAVSLECILLFTFGTGKDENLFINLDKFLTAKSSLMQAAVATHSLMRSPKRVFKLRQLESVIA
jgi:hypothetical protein